MSAENRRLLLAIAAMLAIGGYLYTVKLGHSRDLGQWGAINNDPAIREWYQNLRQPDQPAASCCGEADAYWADEIHVRNGKVYAVITDDRPDAPRMRPHVPIGTEIEVPAQKFKWGAGDTDPTPQRNPSGHGVIFLSRTWFVYCYVAPGGV